MVKFLSKLAKIYYSLPWQPFCFEGKMSLISLVYPTHHISKFGGNRRDAMSNPLWWLCRETFKFLSHFSVRPTKLKLDTHMGKGLIYCVHQIQVARIYLFLYFSSFFLSLQLAKIKNLHLQNCFNLPLMAMARGMWALLTLCYIFSYYFCRFGIWH